jgi:hypothetical protein
MTPYPYQSPATGRKEVLAGPGKLWKRIPSEKRTEAAAAFWQDDDAVEQQAEALLTIASQLRFRTKTVRTLPLEKKVKYLVGLPNVSDSIAGRALVSYHLAHQRPMLGAFLDALGIEHDNGVLAVEELKAPAAETLKEAAAKLRAEYPADAVELYFQTLLVQDPETWGGLADLLEPSGE